ncbi:MAG: baseplate tail-tube junction protein [Candidatus Peribacteraceae bacterium]|nr:baseplate tail-tube junction protein [Candidatus Peribacteraceae bacterium]
MPSFVDQLKDGFSKIQRAEVVDSITNSLAGIVNGNQSITGILEDGSAQNLPYLSYPIDLHGEGQAAFDYSSRIEFTAISYKSRKQAKNEEFLQSKTLAETSSIISLYHPNALNIAYNNEWGTEELGLAGAKTGQAALSNLYNDATSAQAYSEALDAFSGLAAGQLGKKAVEKIGESIGVNASGAVSRSLGVASNPRLAMLFKGVNPRTFSFQFQFAPRSQDEVLQVIAIMKAFRYYAAPDWANVGDSVPSDSFFKYPELFDIKLFHNGEENTSLFPYGTSACTGIDYDYSPQSVWQTFDNGFPVLVNMTLNFNELDIITKDTIRNEFKK